MNKFWKRFFKILMTFVEKCGELLYKFFKHFDGNFVLFLRQFLEKL